MCRTCKMLRDEGKCMIGYDIHSTLKEESSYQGENSKAGVKNTVNSNKKGGKQSNVENPEVIDGNKTPKQTL